MKQFNHQLVNVNRLSKAKASRVANSESADSIEKMDENIVDKRLNLLHTNLQSVFNDALELSKV